MKVPANARVLDSASQTDNSNESSENQTKEEYECEFKQLKLKVKHYETYIQNLKFQTDRSQVNE